jgi:hypothetical protein
LHLTFYRLLAECFVGIGVAGSHALMPNSQNTATLLCGLCPLRTFNRHTSKGLLSAGRHMGYVCVGSSRRIKLLGDILWCDFRCFC